MAREQSILLLARTGNSLTGDHPKAQGATGIEVLDLSVRAYNCLQRAGITTVEQLATYHWGEIAQ